MTKETIIPDFAPEISIQKNIYPVAPEVPRDSRGIRWSRLKNDPEKLKSIIELEARRFLVNGHKLTEQALYESGLANLVNAVHRYYEGGFPSLKVNIGLNGVPKPGNFWAKTEAIELMKEEALAFYRTEGNLSINLLREKNRNDLDNAIRRHYPGGWMQIRKDIDLALDRRQRGSWTAEEIREEARKFLEQEGNLSDSLLAKYDRRDIVGAIRRYYPGKMPQLKKDLGLKPRVVKGSKNDPYWTIEQIENNSREFYEANGGINTIALTENGRQDLLQAIRKYPGGIKALRLKFEVEKGRALIGWMTINALSRKLRENNGAFSERTIKSRAEKFRESNPGWFNPIQNSKGKIVGEYLSPELIALINDELTRFGKAPEGWLTLLGIAKKFFSDRPAQKRGPIRKIISRLSEIYPKLVRNYTGQGGILNYYSPEMIDEIEQIIMRNRISDSNSPSESRQELQKLLEAV